MITNEINDYSIRTVKEAAEKYHPGSSWTAEFDCMDRACPIVVCQFDLVYANSRLLELPLYTVKNQNEELASCILDEAKKTIAFKIGKRALLLSALSDTAQNTELHER